MKSGRGANYPPLQVILETEDGRVLWGPQPVLVDVKDENDEVPRFSQAVYSVQLSQGTRPGEWSGNPAAHCKVRCALMAEQRGKRCPEAAYKQGSLTYPVSVPSCTPLSH